MIKKSLVIFTMIFVFLAPLPFAQAYDPDPNYHRECVSEELYKQQQIEIQSLKRDREARVQEIQRLQAEIGQLNETLDNIRSQIGNNAPRPY